MLTPDLLALMSLALVAGAVSFTSPCALPLLPGYVAFVSGLGAGDAAEARRLRPVLVGSGLFVAGFTAVFTALGATASALGLLLVQNLRTINVVSGAVVVVMGLLTTGVLRLPALERQRRVDLGRLGRGPRGAPVLGAAFAFGWTPCVGPVLASILATAAGTGTVARGTALLVAYSAGLGIPFVLVAIAVARGRAGVPWLRRHSRHIEVIGGLLLVLMGVLLMTGGWTRVMSAVLRYYARLGWPPI